MTTLHCISLSAPFFQQHLHSVSHFGDSEDISDFYVVIFVTLICDITIVMF